VIAAALAAGTNNSSVHRANFGFMATYPINFLSNALVEELRSQRFLKVGAAGRQPHWFGASFGVWGEPAKVVTGPEGEKEIDSGCKSCGFTGRRE
jgi:hypothetical protein